MIKNGNFAVAMSVTLLFGGAAFAAGTPQQKCQQAKLKAQGKYQACIKKNAAGVIVGKDDAAATCQTKFAAALTKADDKAAAAVPPTSCRYIDNGDGTVSDLNTGLLWEQKTASGIHNVTTAYTWASSGTAPSGTAFTNLLGTLNIGTSSDGTNTLTPCFAGHCDWRLPTIQELRGILDLSAAGCGSGSPCIDPAFGSTIAGFYWSATTFSSSSTAALGVYFGLGSVGDDPKTSFIYTRAVRGGL